MFLVVHVWSRGLLFGFLEGYGVRITVWGCSSLVSSFSVESVILDGTDSFSVPTHLLGRCSSFRCFRPLGYLFIRFFVYGIGLSVV